MLRMRRLACSFCGKTAAHVKKLVAGRRAYICDACAAEVQRIMAASDSDAGPPTDAPATRPVWRSGWAALGHWIRDRRHRQTFGATHAV